MTRMLMRRRWRVVIFAAECSDQSAEDLVDMALALMARQGFDSTTTEQISAAAGVDADPADALLAALFRVLADIGARADAVPRKRMELLVAVTGNSPQLEKKVSARRELKMWSAVAAASRAASLDKHRRFDPEVNALKPGHISRARLNRAFRVITGTSRQDAASS